MIRASVERRNFGQWIFVCFFKSDGDTCKVIDIKTRELKEFGPHDFVADSDMVKLHDEEAFALYQSLHEYFKANGRRPSDQSVVEGKLEAQGRHLEDLRHLLKLPKA